MNIFRLVADSSHTLAILILLYKICVTRSCSGTSGRSQILYALVFFTRYLDLFFYFVSLYNTALKIFYVASTLSTVFFIYCLCKHTPQDRQYDSFNIVFLVIPAGLLAIFMNHESNALEILWTFSIYLEAVAMLPQFSMIKKSGELGSMMGWYLCCLGAYRGLYILNWVYRYYTENFYDLIALSAGIVQTILYIDFYISYKFMVAQRGVEEKKALPFFVEASEDWTAVETKKETCKMDEP